MKRRKGFTLIELMVALGCLITIGYFAYLGIHNIIVFSKASAAKAGAANLAGAVIKYKYEIGAFPSSLQSLTNKKPGFSQYGPWIVQTDLKDPWGREYNYSYSTANNQYAIWSNGSDGRDDSGGGGEKITNDISGDDQGLVAK